MKRALIIAVVALAGCQKPAAAPAPEAAPAAPQVELQKLTLEQVEAKLGQAGVFLFDANPKELYDRAHLPGAAWVKFDAVEASALPSDKGATLVFYCANELCTASHDAARQALALGYANTFVMPQGYIGWKKSGRRLVGDAVDAGNG